MLKKGQSAPQLAEGQDQPIQTIDGRSVTITELSRKGPVVMVLLRGFS